MPGPRSAIGVGLTCAALAFGGLLVYGLIKQAPNDTVDERLRRGRAAAAPSFDLSVLDGGRRSAALARPLGDGRVSLDELRGAPAVLNFWASWCLPCREEAPELERASRTSRGRGLTFVGINMQDVRSDARAFLRRFNVSYLNVRDPSDDVARRWGLTGIPETFFLDSGGRVVGHVSGAASAGQLREGMGAARTGRPLRPRIGGERRNTR